MPIASRLMPIQNLPSQVSRRVFSPGMDNLPGTRGPIGRLPRVVPGGGAIPTTMRTGGGAIPSLKKGGKVKRTGVYKLHKGERVVSAARVLGAGKKSKPWRSKKGQSKIHKTMSEFKSGTLHSGSKHGPKVTSRKQAVAIALSQARKEG
jgi:hypothetical protein